MEPLGDNGRVKRSYEGELSPPAKPHGSSEKCFTVAVLIITGRQSYKPVPDTLSGQSHYECSKVKTWERRRI